MEKTVLILMPCTDEQRNRFIQAVNGEMTLLFREELASPEEMKNAFSKANVIIGEPDLADIADSHHLEWIQMTWAGTDKYTCHTGFPKGVTLTNMSGAFGTIMSEYAIGAILSCYRRFPAYRAQQEQHIWADAGSEDSLYGKTALLLGTGDIGSNTAKRLQVFGCHTIGVRRHKENVPPYFDKMFSFEEIDQLLPTVDIVLCSLPNKPQTRNLLDKKRLSLMKKDALLLNMGRGSLIVMEDLVDLLSQGHLRGVILDVTNPEPLPAGHPLWDFDRVMITPHIAGPSLGHCPDTENRIVDICCDNLTRFLHNECLLHVVPAEEFEV